MSRTDLTEKQWRQLGLHLPSNPHHGHAYVKHRHVINGILWRLTADAGARHALRLRERRDAQEPSAQRASKRSRPRFDEAAYKGRNVVERAINRLKGFRAVATRYDKPGHNFLAAVILATIMLWLL